MSNLTAAKRALGRHVVAHCLESDVEDHTPDGVEWSYREWTIQSLREKDDGTIEVSATQDGSQSERVARATRHHPAEYETYEGTIHLTARANWSDSPLAGECHASLDFEGGVPSRPIPEPDPF